MSNMPLHQKYALYLNSSRKKNVPRRVGGDRPNNATFIGIQSPNIY